MYCKYLSKTFQNGFKCKLYKKHIEFPLTCEKCLERNVVRNKAIKKVSKKRICVTEETYQKVFERDKGVCVMFNSDCEGKIELHHICYRSERKDLINEPTNCVCLCTFHHKLVHSNKKIYKPLLLEMVKNKL